MTAGLVGIPHSSLAGMVNAIHAKISREALHLRFTPAAVSFMKKCVDFVLHAKSKTMTVIDARLLNHFKNVYLFDSTSWDIDPKLHAIFPGSGGDASKANCKVQLCYEYLRGALSFFEILPGTKTDRGYTVKLPDLIAPGDLLIADLGYFSLQTLQRIAANGAFFLFRLLAGTCTFDARTLQPIVLCDVLKKVVGNAYQLDIIMGVDDEQRRVNCRLVCLRVSDNIANERRRKLKRNAARKGKMVSEKQLFLAGWILMVSNIPKEWLAPEMLRPLYSLRWQIELLFKQLKSVLAIHQSATSKEPRLLCELMGKLIMAILIHRIHADANIHWWNNKRQEISMDKLYKRFQERSFILANLLLVSLSKAVRYLISELSLLMKDCRKLKQKSRLSSLEFLETSFVPYVQELPLNCLT